MDLFDNYNFKNATLLDFNGRIDSPYWPGKIVPKFSKLGNFKNDLPYI
jgi:hypothetical protein